MITLEDTLYCFVLFGYTPYVYRKAYKTNNERSLHVLSAGAVSFLAMLVPLSHDCYLATLTLLGCITLLFKAKIQKTDPGLIYFAFLFLLVSLDYIRHMIQRIS
jgi:hypothetical protein